MKAVDEKLWVRKAKTSSTCDNLHLAGNGIGCQPERVKFWSVNLSSIEINV
jgi:hypothetical protein